ncbi:hypothetical protein HKX42_07945 [Salinisphaera sp. USBA-960]|nr:hypothetical protein [Salifodinibacter halophilus]NNC26803.1 hypothetical protein [Salifodinibacter halophilus]
MRWGWLTVILMGTLVAGCVTAPPQNPSNVCSIFREKDDWYSNAKQSADRWRAPIPVQMAIIHQESGYQAQAKPARNYVLGFIPWGHISSAYGYTQALDATWERYENATGNGGADRDDFGDATNFVGWYMTVTHKKLGIPMRAARRQYLAYYFGQAGYQRGAYRGHPKIQRVARNVAQTANRYNRQLASCRQELENRGHWWWPF